MSLFFASMALMMMWARWVLALEEFRNQTCVRLTLIPEMQVLTCLPCVKKKKTGICVRVHRYWSVIKARQSDQNAIKCLLKT